MKTIAGKNIEIFVVYHDKTAIVENNLNELDPELYTPYYTKDNHPDSYDDIQQYICEFTAQKWALYHSNSELDYIGFCQYHRILQLNDDAIFTNESNGAAVKVNTSSWHSLQTEKFVNFLNNDLINYIKYNYSKEDVPYKLFIENQHKFLPYAVNELYIAKYDIFMEAAGFVAGFIDYVDKVNDLNHNPKKYYEFILNGFIGPKLETGLEESDKWYLEKNCTNFFRVIANYIEFLIGMYIGHYIAKIEVINENENDKTK